MFLMRLTESFRLRASIHLRIMHRLNKSRSCRQASAFSLELELLVRNLTGLLPGRPIDPESGQKQTFRGLCSAVTAKLHLARPTTSAQAERLKMEQ